MLPDNFFLWPYQGDSLDECISDIAPLLEKSALSAWDMAGNPAGRLAEYVALICREWNVSPFWVLTSAQREQSTLTTPGVNFTAQATRAWLGVVGQDVGRVTLPGYYGIYAQVQRCCETTAWLMGVESSDHWPLYLRTRKQAPRYQIGKAIDIDAEGAPVAGKPGTFYAAGDRLNYVPVSRGDWTQLQYTPHWRILKTNELIARDITPTKFL